MVNVPAWVMLAGGGVFFRGVQWKQCLKWLKLSDVVVELVSEHRTSISCESMTLRKMGNMCRYLFLNVCDCANRARKCCRN